MPRQFNARSVLVAVGLALFAVPSAWAQTADPKTADDAIVAQVEGKPIHRSEVLQAFSGLPQQMQKAGFETIYPQLVERMIQQRLLVIHGRKNNFAENDVVKRRLKRLEDAVIGEVYLNQLIEENLTPGLIDARYKEFLQQNPPTDEVRARHILLKTETDAKNVIGHIDAGKIFEDAAKEFSTGPSATSGGDLGFFKRGDMVKPFSEAAFALKSGDVTPLPVKTRFGWHVIKVEDRRSTQPPSFEEMKPRLLRDLGRTVAAGVMGQLVEKATVERFTLDGNPMPAPPKAPKTQ
jgi:peptidyl-prolyl cis-trans isomerase C